MKKEEDDKEQNLEKQSKADSFPILANVLSLQCNEYCHELMTDMIIRNKQRPLSSWSIQELHCILRHFILFYNHNGNNDSNLINVWIHSIDQEIKKRNEILKAAANMVQVSSSSLSTTTITSKRNSIFSLISQASKLSIDIASSLSTLSIIDDVKDENNSDNENNIGKDNIVGLSNQGKQQQDSEQQSMTRENIINQINKIAAITCEVDTYLERISESCFGSSIPSSSMFLDDTIYQLEQQSSFDLGKCKELLHLYFHDTTNTATIITTEQHVDVENNDITSHLLSLKKCNKIGIDFICKLANICHQDQESK